MSCLISFERCQSNCEEGGTSEHYKKLLSTVGFEPLNTAPLVFQRVPLNHSATETVDDMWIELLQYLFTLRYYKTSVPCAKGYTENENKNNCWLTVWWLIPFKYEMINTKEEIFYVLYVNDSIIIFILFLFIIKVSDFSRKPFCFRFVFLRLPTLVGNLSVFVLSFLIKVSD